MKLNKYNTLKDNILLLGIDGGATKVSARNLTLNKKTERFSLGKFSADCSYNEIEGFISNFKPTEISVQLAERDNGTIKPTEEENKQAATYIEACARVIESVVKQSGVNQIVVGLGMPGLKTKDKRGISVIANGPRMIDYADKLEKRLTDTGITFVTPIAHLGSDADYCGIGENYSEDGKFKNIKNAYYLGGGTGVADALKLNGKLLPFDETKDWLAKTWEMKSTDGRSLERFTSVGGLQSIYAEIAGKKVSELNEKGIYPIQIAELSAKGNPDAKKMIQSAVENISLLLFERITGLYAGSRNTFKFVNPTRPKLSSDHPYLKYVFDRIIIGQRLGDLFESQSGYTEIRKPVIKKLNELIKKSDLLDEKAKLHYADSDKIIVSSELREAPAIGAGIDAYFNWKKIQ